MNNKCPLCKIQVKIGDMGGYELITVNCASCRTFSITREVKNELEIRHAEDIKLIAYIRGWIRERQPNADATNVNLFPIIDMVQFNKMLNRKDMSNDEKSYRLLKRLKQQTEYPGKMLNLIKEFKDLPPICYAANEVELNFLLKNLNDRGFIDSSNRQVMVKPAGFSYLEKFDKSEESKLV